MPLIYDYPSTSYHAIVNKYSNKIPQVIVTQIDQITGDGPPLTGILRKSNSPPPKPVKPPKLRQAQQSSLAKAVILNTANIQQAVVVPSDPLISPAVPVLAHAADMAAAPTSIPTDDRRESIDSKLMPPPPKTVISRALGDELSHEGLRPPQHQAPVKNGVGVALTDTPLPSAPGSPQINPSSTGTSTPSKHARATTLDIPGLTKSKVSPDGKIAQRDVGAKLVIVMVGLPARGKSYITKKMARYLNWLQHDTRIFNVGNRRRVAAGSGLTLAASMVDDELRQSVRRMSLATPGSITAPQGNILPPPALTPRFMINGETPKEASKSASQLRISTSIDDLSLAENPVDENKKPDELPKVDENEQPTEQPTVDEDHRLPAADTMDQSASFFDPDNAKAVQIREQVAIETLDELLDYILFQGGSVGILDATNSTLERRKAVMNRIRERAGPDLGVLFVESRCVDEQLLEKNMRLKLSGPDYKGHDPLKSLNDFKQRIKEYEKSYVPLGDYEEKNNMAYVQMIDVGRKIVSHQINGFLASQAVYYLLNFNLAPRQIWITRHGESQDNVLGKIGGDSDLSPAGVKYAKALPRFIDYQRQQWIEYQHQKALSTHFPPHPGDHSPPNPDYNGDVANRNFCVWTSMLNRSIQTGEYFNEDEYDVKQFRMLDELNAGLMEGMTYEEIRTRFSDEYELRKRDKLHYRYPGAGGEGYLDIINRLRAIIVEVERMTDHALLITHRSIARVLLAYFLGLDRDRVAELDVPLGVLYMLEPKPYGVEFRAYRYNPQTEWFDFVPDYQLRRATGHHG